MWDDIDLNEIDEDADALRWEDDMFFNDTMDEIDFDIAIRNRTERGYFDDDDES